MNTQDRMISFVIEHMVPNLEKRAILIEEAKASFKPGRKAKAAIKGIDTAIKAKNKQDVMNSIANTMVELGSDIGYFADCCIDAVIPFRHQVQVNRELVEGQTVYQKLADEFLINS